MIEGTLIKNKIGRWGFAEHELTSGDAVEVFVAEQWIRGHRVPARHRGIPAYPLQRPGQRDLSDVAYRDAGATAYEQGPALLPVSPGILEAPNFCSPGRAPGTCAGIRRESPPQPEPLRGAENAFRQSHILGSEKARAFVRAQRRPMNLHAGAARKKARQ